MSNLSRNTNTAPETGTDKQALMVQREIESLEANLSMLYYELGKKIYETAEPDIAEIGRTVDKLIEAKQSQLRLTRQRPCPHCLALNPATNEYCGKCGNKLTE